MTVKVGKLYRTRLVNRVKEGMENNASVFLLGYSHLSGFKMNSLRKNLKKAGADVFVTKNSLIQIALKDIKQDQLSQNLKGQSAVVLSNADSSEVSKILLKFTKDFETLKLQGGISDGRVLDSADIKRLSDLPSKQVLLTMLLGTLQSPLTRLAGALNAKTRDLLSILKQLSEKKGGS